MPNQIDTNPVYQNMEQLLSHSKQYGVFIATQVCFFS